MPFVWVPKFQSFNYSTDTPSPSAISFWNQTLAISHNVTLAKLAMPLFFRLMSVAGRRNPATNWRQWISIASLINEKSEDLKMIRVSKCTLKSCKSFHTWVLADVSVTKPQLILSAARLNAVHGVSFQSHQSKALPEKRRADVKRYHDNQSKATWKL